MKGDMVQAQVEMLTKKKNFTLLPELPRVLLYLTVDSV
jgi:hypothetical protein